MRVLSLFDGLGGARLALDQLGITPDIYYASEIDKSAMKVASHHFPDIVQLGDIRSVKAEDLGPIDLLIGGSPCQDLSRGGNMEGLQGERSSLFFEFIRLLTEVNPDFFLLENVKSMKKDHMNEMNEIIGCAPLIINSKDWTPQNRTRCYWTNITVADWTAQNSKLKDVWDFSVEGDPIYDIAVSRLGEDMWRLAPNKRKNPHGMESYAVIPVSDHAGPPLPREKVFLIEGNARACTTAPSQFPLYCHKVDTAYPQNSLVRITTPLECERLQGLPDNYTKIDGVSDNQRYIMVGNGFTTPVIRHLLASLAE